MTCWALVLLSQADMENEIKGKTNKIKIRKFLILVSLKFVNQISKVIYCHLSLRSQSTQKMLS